MFLKRLLATVTIVLLVVAATCSICLADDHKDNDGHKGKGESHHGADHGEKDDDVGAGRERGGEEAGVVAAIVFSAANATVAFSLVRRLFIRVSTKKTGFIKNLVKMDVYQKKLLLPVHYYLNLAGIAVVSWHWFALQCDKSAMPEVGAILLIVLCVLGLIVKLKLPSNALVSFVKRIHTSSISATVVVVALLIGHVVVD